MNRIWLSVWFPFFASNYSVLAAVGGSPVKRKCIFTHILCSPLNSASSAWVAFISKYFHLWVFDHQMLMPFQSKESRCSVVLWTDWMIFILFYLFIAYLFRVHMKNIVEIRFRLGVLSLRILFYAILCCPLAINLVSFSHKHTAFYILRYISTVFFLSS